MLTDIFADRYLNQKLFFRFTQAESKLLVQCFQLVSTEVMPLQAGGDDSVMKARWQEVHNRLCREFGRDSLAPTSYNMAVMSMLDSSGLIVQSACRDFVTARYDNSDSDRFIKERLSFVELAFRLQGESVAQDCLPPTGTRTATGEAFRQASIRRSAALLTGSLGMDSKPAHQVLKERFDAQVAELNTRFRQAGTPLNYHNGFIQISQDERIEKEIEKPFWTLVASPTWKNVDIDMKEALDKRDSGDRDPAFYAARALESAIKIISSKKGWTTNKENGAANFIDNLGSEKNGRFIAEWERDALKAFFSKVRNPLGHGPGEKPIAELTPAQTDWAIETCMSWTKTLIGRL